MGKIYEKKFSNKKFNNIINCYSIITALYGKISEPEDYLSSVSDLQHFHDGKEYCKNHEQRKNGVYLWKNIFIGIFGVLDWISDSCRLYICQR